MPPTQPPAQSAASVSPQGFVPGPAPAIPSPTIPQSRVDTDQAARKRQEIGLTPRRATARQAVARPPDARLLNPLLQWALVGVVAALALITLALIAARLSGDATDAASVGRALTAAVEDPATLLDGEARPAIGDEFDGAESLLVRDFQPRRWSMGAVDGLYRIRMWPGVIAWSTLGQGPLANVRLATSVTVAGETPQGYGGIIARYSDDDHFYLVEIDGGRRYRVIARAGGVWTTVHDWELHPALKQAGLPNELVVEDRSGEAGSTISIFANGEALLTTTAITLPAGDAGVVAGSLEPSVAQADFDWLRVTALE